MVIPNAYPIIYFIHICKCIIIAFKGFQRSEWVFWCFLLSQSLIFSTENLILFKHCAQTTILNFFPQCLKHKLEFPCSLFLHPLHKRWTQECTSVRVPVKDPQCTGRNTIKLIHSVDIAQPDTIKAQRSHRPQNTIPLIYSWKERIIYNENAKNKWKKKKAKDISYSKESW